MQCSKYKTDVFSLHVLCCIMKKKMKKKKYKKESGSFSFFFKKLLKSENYFLNTAQILIHCKKCLWDFYKLRHDHSLHELKLTIYII